MTDLLPIGRAALHLGMSTRQLKRLIHTRQIAGCYKVGGTFGEIRINVEEARASLSVETP